MALKPELQQLVTCSEPDSPAAEAYRQLRTNIQFAGVDKPIKSILITSPGVEEGKSATLANLAVSFAQTGRPVVLVDCDLRRPSIHELFGLQNHGGVTTCLAHGDYEKLPLVETGVPNLRLLPAGPTPPNPSELLGSQRMVGLLAELEKTADYVLIDTPPVVAVTDAAVLAPRVDAVVLVIRAGKTKREMARRAKTILDRVKANLLGVVMNNVKYDSRIHGYYARKPGSG